MDRARNKLKLHELENHLQPVIERPPNKFAHAGFASRSRARVENTSARKVRGGIGDLVKKRRREAPDRPECQKSGAAKTREKKFFRPRRSSSLLAFARHYRHLLMELPVRPRSWPMIGPLPSPRHELFAQAVASGMSASKSYALAYYRPRNGATRASAARLLTNVNAKRESRSFGASQPNRRKHHSKLLFQLSRSAPALLSQPDV
jgi:hypothetical protein